MLNPEAALLAVLIFSKDIFFPSSDKDSPLKILFNFSFFVAPEPEDNATITFPFFVSTLVCFEVTEELFIIPRTRFSSP